MYRRYDPKTNPQPMQQARSAAQRPAQGNSPPQRQPQSPQSMQQGRSHQQNNQSSPARNQPPTQNQQRQMPVHNQPQNARSGGPAMPLKGPAPNPGARQSGYARQSQSRRQEPPPRHAQSSPSQNPKPRSNPQGSMPEDAHKKKLKLPQNPILGFIPSSIYNPETKKVLGLLSAEDLLLAAMIFLLLENEENDDPMLVYALIYILISDYIDLPF